MQGDPSDKAELQSFLDQFYRRRHRLQYGDHVGENYKLALAHYPSATVFIHGTLFFPSKAVRPKTVMTHSESFPGQFKLTY